MSVLTDIAVRARDAAENASLPVLAATGLHVLDATACVVSGSSHPLAGRWIPLLPNGSGCDPETLGTQGRRPVETAIEIESTLAHVDEFDALHQGAGVAPGAMVVPAALHVGALHHASGLQVARAIVAGHEACIEASLRFGGPDLYSAGWWPTAVFGALGSAATTGTLIGLDETMYTTALALAASSLGGLLADGTLGDAHYLLGGRAAAHGVWAARAASAGLTADVGLLDGPARTALGRAPHPASTTGLPHIVATGFKKWPCARPLHAALAGLTTFTAAGVDLAAVDIIDIGLPTAALRFVTTEHRPVNPAAAAASAAVVTGGMIVGRAADPGWYREVAAGTVTLPRPTVRVHADPELDAHFPARWGAAVTVRIGGRSDRVHVFDPPGSVENPLTRDEHDAKVAMLCPMFDRPLRERIRALPDEADISVLRAEMVSAIAGQDDRSDRARNSRTTAAN